MLCARRAFNEDGCRCPECSTVKPKSRASVLRHRVLARYGDACYLCGAADAITIDHVVPLSRGGTNAISNLRPCCYSCNMEKADRMPA